MNIFHTLERLSWIVNKRSAKKILIDHLDFNVISRPRSEDFSILIQGPINSASQHFFIKLLDSYRNIFGSERIRVACSLITDDACDYLLKHKIGWIKSKVADPGPGNIFFQAKSVTEGLQICEHDTIVKVRNDQFIQRWDFIDAQKDQIYQDKLFVCGYTLINPLFHVADMLHYGSKKNLEIIWGSISDNEKMEKLLEKYHFSEWSIHCKHDQLTDNIISPEVILGLSIASFYGYADLSLKTYLDIIQSRLICSSNTDIGLQWGKHNAVLDFHRAWTQTYRETIDYQKWLAIKSINNKRSY